MTVGELIKQLSTFPINVEVVGQVYDDIGNEWISIDDGLGIVTLQEVHFSDTENPSDPDDVPLVFLAFERRPDN